MTVILFFTCLQRMMSFYQLLSNQKISTATVCRAGQQTFRPVTLGYVVPPLGGAAERIEERGTAAADR